MIPRLLRMTAWLASALVLAGFALLCSRNLLAPQPQGVIEQGLLDLALRTAAHGPLYDAPAAAGTPALLPAFPLVASVLIGTLGTSMVWLRLISLISIAGRSEEHTSELQSLRHLVCRLLLAKKK